MTGLRVRGPASCGDGVACTCYGFGGCRRRSLFGSLGRSIQNVVAIFGEDGAKERSSCCGTTDDDAETRLDCREDCEFGRCI